MGEAPSRRYRFGVFEVDAGTGELRQQGMRIRLHRQPFEVLCLLLERPGEVLTREEICKALWPDGTFVDYEHGVNATVNRLREALRDKAAAPRYIETLPRRGYRFLGAVEKLAELNEAGRVAGDAESPVQPIKAAAQTAERAQWLTSPEDLPAASPSLVRTLFLLLQAMYLAFYVGALANLGEIRELLSFVTYPEAVFWVLSVTAGVLIPVRISLLSAALLHPPEVRKRYLQCWPVLLGVDMLWALGPFLLLHHISFGLALACVTPLVYAPFAQRSLVLMGALPET